MPHVIIEYAETLDHDMQALCDAVFEVLAQEKAIPDPASLKIRAIPYRHFRIGTEPQTFAHATLQLLDGRDDATKAHLTGVTLATMRRCLPDVGSLTVDLRDMPRATYAKSLL